MLNIHFIYLTKYALMNYQSVSHIFLLFFCMNDIYYKTPLFRQLFLCYIFYEHYLRNTLFSLLAYPCDFLYLSLSLYCQKSCQGCYYLSVVHNHKKTLVLRTFDMKLTDELVLNIYFHYILL